MRLAKIVTTLAAAVMLTACASAPSGLAPEGRLDREDIIGTWRNAEGTTAEVTSQSGHSYAIRINEAKDYYPMSLHPLGAKLVAEIVFNREKKTPPVFMYGLIQIDGNELTYRALSDDWLEKRAAKSDSVTFVRMDSESGEPPHGVMASDAAGLRAMLIDAVNDPDAWKDPEPWKRVK